MVKKLNAVKLNQDTCENLLKEYFKVEKSSFYQKLSFINIIACQLIFFNGNYALSTEQLKEIGREKKQPDLPNIRTFIINALIKNTEHFTKGAYSNLIQHQEFSQNRQIGKYDEDKALDEAIKKLENKEYVSYKQIKPSLVFCNLDGGSLSIITNCKKNEQEYKDLTQLYSSDIIGTRNLIDYQNTPPETFFEEINKVLDLKSNTENIKKIVGSYVFTSDNFIKMILIIFRIQANIPVIMMGETGCGKTSLIRIISQLLKSEMKTLNIHAGISDKDIIEFMEGKVKGKMM